MAVSTGPSIRAACRVLNQNSCGSGAVCGKDARGSYILTNAHVAGTTIGRKVQVDVVVNGQTKRINAVVIMAAYSDKTLTDWAMLFAEGFFDIDPVKLSKKRPSGSHYTQGSPRCVWPQVSTDITTKDIDDDSPLWRWTQPSIGGQSGSPVYSDDDNLQYGLLTWLWGGFGAGQMTSEIYRQSVNQTVAAAPRIDGLTIPPLDPAIAPLPAGEKTNVDTDPILENGFYQQVGIIDLPVWAEDSAPPPPLPDNPDTTRKLLVEYHRESAEFHTKWQNRFMTEKEQLGPGNPKPGGGGGSHGL